MLNKDRVITFLIGVIAGIFITFIFLSGMFVMYKMGAKVFNYMSQSSQKKEHKIAQTPTLSRGRIFKISFENKEDLEFFGQADGLYVEQSKEHVTDGNYSLLTEFPKGAQYPGLSWEVHRKDKCLNWNGAKFLSFDAHNNSEVEAKLIAKFKSGPNYPKKTYQTYIELPSQQSKNVRISVDELKGALNIEEISYIKLFIDNPHANITLYFDNIRLEY